VSGLYEPDLLSAAAAVEDGAPDKYQRVAAQIRKHTGREGLVRWERAVRKRRKIKQTDEPASPTFSLMDLFSEIAEKGFDRPEMYNLFIPKSAHEVGTEKMILEGCDGGDDDRAKGFIGAITNPGAVAYLLCLMNRDFALVIAGTNVRVVKVDPHGEPVFLRCEEASRIFDNVRIAFSRSKMDYALSAHTINLFDVWRQWPKRRTCHHVGFYPGSKLHPPTEPKDTFNLWTGFAAEPVKGRWDRLHEHLLDIICDGDPEKLKWLLDWFADLIQHPQHKPGTAVVFRSAEEGTGKSLLINALLAKIFGVHCLLSTKTDHITGRFNGHLQALLLLGAEEAVYAGSKAAEGTLKELITAQRLTYERKGLQAYEGDNFTRVMMFSNEEWSVPAGPFSRRYFVLDVNPKRRGDTVYFDRLHEELENGGVEAFLYDMLRRKITSNLREAPVTEGLRMQRELSLDAISRWVLKLARDGYVDDQEGKRLCTFSASGETDVVADNLRRCFPRSLSRYEDRSLETRLGNLLAKLGVRSERPMKKGGRKSLYVFPPLPKFQTAAQKQFSVPVLDGFGDLDTAARWLRKRIDPDKSVSLVRLKKHAEKDGLDWVTVKSAIKTSGMEYSVDDDGKTCVQWSDVALDREAA